MKNGKIDESISGYYNSSNEDYEDFLDSINGGNDHEDESGGDTINIKGVLDKFRKKAAEMSGVSKRNASDIKEDIKQAKDIPPEDTDIEEIAVDIEDLKKEIADIVKLSLNEADIEGCIKRGINVADGGQDIANRMTEVKEKFLETENKLSSVSDGLESVKRRLQAMQQATESGMHDNVKKIDGIGRNIDSLKTQTGEVIQTLSGVAKLSDSVFDLKNSQMNTKNTIEVLNLSVRALKKKMTAAVTVMSIIAVVIVIFQIINLLS